MGELTAMAILQAIVGPEEMAEICRQLGGEQIYVPSKLPLDGQLICNEFVEFVHSGSTSMSAYQALADEHNVSSRTIQRKISGGNE